MAENVKDSKLEREYIIPLRKRWSIVPRYKRANKAIRSIKEFLVKHMKIRDGDLDKIKVDKYLNEEIWHRGIRNPPAKIKVKAIKEGDIVRVELVDMPDRIKFKKLRRDKLNEKGKEIASKKKEAKEETKQEPEKTSEEDKKEVKEDIASTVEAGKGIQKVEATKAKHETKAKSPKEQKNTRTGYNQQSKGH